MIPYSSQWIDDADIAAVTEVLRSDWITQGPAVEHFEAKLARYCGAKYAVAVSSGTAGLHLASIVAELSPGGKVATSPITFVASANCVLYAGSSPHFVDIDAKTRNISIEGLEGLVADEKVDAVIPVHFSGLPCDVERVFELSRLRGFKVIEDACHALGAEYRSVDGSWHRVGSCRHSDMTVFSFHPVKHIATGEGGAVTTNSPELYERLIRLRTHGITKDLSQMQENHGPWYYEMHELGFNYRITDFQCALGSSQLEKLDRWLNRRREIAKKYDDAFLGNPAIKTPAVLAGAKSAYHLYVIEVPNRRSVFEHLRAAGIGCQVHYIPVHLQPYYREHLSYKEGDYPVSEAYYSKCISIPLFPRMSDVDVETVISAIESAIKATVGQYDHE